MATFVFQDLIFVRKWAKVDLIWKKKNSCGTVRETTLDLDRQGNFVKRFMWEPWMVMWEPWMVNQLGGGNVKLDFSTQLLWHYCVFIFQSSLETSFGVRHCALTIDLRSERCFLPVGQFLELFQWTSASKQNFDNKDRWNQWTLTLLFFPLTSFSWTCKANNQEDNPDLLKKNVHPNPLSGLHSTQQVTSISPQDRKVLI